MDMRYIVYLYITCMDICIDICIDILGHSLAPVVMSCNVKPKIYFLPFVYTGTNQDLCANKEF
jgi:hypothetical protein